MLLQAAYRRRLKTDLERWVDCGLVDRASADAMLADSRPASRHGLVTALAFVVVILLGAGLIAIVAANWQDIPRELRVAGLWTINVGILVACLAFTLRFGALSLATEASAALAVLAAVASISLIGQIYHFPSNWPGFGLAMVAIAGATVLVTRSTACVWLAAAAMLVYRGASLEAIEPHLVGRGSLAAGWMAHGVTIVAATAGLAALILGGWIARAGAGTFLVLLAPLFWVLASRDWVLWTVGLPLLWLAGAIVVAEIVAHDRRAAVLARFVPPERLEAAVSAMLGLVVVVYALMATQHLWHRGGFWPTIGVSRPLCWIGAVLAAVLAAAARRRLDDHKAAQLWLAAALAAPFLGSIFVTHLGGGYVGWRADSSTFNLVRLVALVLVPLVLLAVATRVSNRHKTFAACIIVLVGTVISQLWSTKDLLSFAGVMFAAAAVTLAVLVATRFLPGARVRSATGEGV